MISTIIIDDKPLAIEILQGYLKKIPFAHFLGQFTSSLAAFDFIELHQPDLVLLDIQMPEITGIQLMKMTRAKSRFILVTAYDNYAIEGFDYNAVDYLLKPVSFDRFYQAMQKAKQLIESSREGKTSTPVTVIKDFIFIRTERRIRKIILKDILFIEARQNYVEFYLPDERILALQTLKQTEDLLPKEQFRRVHKSFILAIAAIQSIEQHQAFIRKHSIPIGEAYRADFYRLIGTT